MKLVSLSRPLLSGALVVAVGSALLAGQDPISPPPPHIPDHHEPGNHYPVAPAPVFIPPILAPGQNPVFVAGTGAIDAQTVSQAATDGISQALKEIVDFCSGISSAEYQVDCLGDSLGAVAAELPTTGDYAEVRAALEVASRDLSQLARNNASTSLPSGIARQASDPTVSSTRPLVPVRTESLPEVNAEATEILEELETTLLRSVANSDSRSAHYQQIAAAVGTNKVLLRSS